MIKLKSLKIKSQKWKKQLKNIRSFLQKVNIYFIFMNIAFKLLELTLDELF